VSSALRDSDDGRSYRLDHGSKSSYKADYSYIPTPVIANFALGSDAVRGQLKVLYPATRWSRGRNPIGRNAMITRETWNTDGIL